MTEESIELFYQQMSSTELLETDLVASIAISLSKMEIYDESKSDSIVWANSNLVEQNGILVWTEMRTAVTITRLKQEFFNFREQDITALQEFIRKHGFADFSEDFLKTLGRFLICNYKYVEMIGMLAPYIDQKQLCINMWNDFIQSKNPRFIVHFNEGTFIDFILDTLPTVGLGDICIFLSESLKAQKYYEVLFRVSTLTDTKHSELSDLLLNVEGVVPIMRYIIDRYYSEMDSDDPYRYNVTIAVLLVIKYMIDNRNFLELILQNTEVETARVGSIGMRDSVTKILQSILITSHEDKLSSYNDPDMSIVDSQSLCNLSMSPESAISAVEQSSTFANISGSFINTKKIARLVFDCFYRLAKKSVPLEISEMDKVKSIIEVSRGDFYILKRSLLLVSNDVEFIYNNYMSQYKPILAQISEMEIRDEFFKYLTKTQTRCTIEIIVEAWRYFDNARGIDEDDLFRKSQILLVDRCKRSCAVYKKIKGVYRRIDTFTTTQEQKEHAPGFRLQPKLQESEIASFTEPNMPLGSLVVLQEDSLPEVLSLAEKMYQKNPSLFVSSLPAHQDVLCFFGILPFNSSLFKSLLRMHKIFPYSVLATMAQILPAEKRTEIIREEAEFIRGAFGTRTLDAPAMQFLLELFKNQCPSDLSRIVFTNLLHFIELKASDAKKNSSSLEDELKLLERMVKIAVENPGIVTRFKSCCAELLESKKHRERALQIIYTYILQNPNCKVFIDWFSQYFNKSFFGFGMQTKKRIFEAIAGSSNFDPFVIVQNLIAGTETSFFMSSQSDEVLKINSLRRISFLILSQPRNRFSSMSDGFVALINRFIHISPEIKIECIRLCTVLMLKIDNNYIQTLFPILVEDFMNTVLSKDLRVVSEMFRFVDTSIWLNSPVFTFKVLFLEGHSFFTQLRSQISSDVVPENTLSTDRQSLPSFLVNAFGKITTWAQLSFYLKKAPEYYSYIEYNMVSKDTELVESVIAQLHEDQT